VAAHDNLGLAFAQAGRITEAMAQFQIALQLDPNDEKARQSLDKLASPKNGPPGN
jgi:Tfp pilus assembly protein PilF